MLINMESFLKELLEKHKFEWRVNYTERTFDSSPYTELVGLSDNYRIQVNCLVLEHLNLQTIIRLLIETKFSEQLQLNESITYEIPIVEMNGYPKKHIPISYLSLIADIAKEQKIEILSKVSFVSLEKGDKEVSEKIRFLDNLYYLITGKFIEQDAGGNNANNNTK